METFSLCLRVLRGNSDFKENQKSAEFASLTGDDLLRVVLTRRFVVKVRGYILVGTGHGQPQKSLICKSECGWVD